MLKRWSENDTSDVQIMHQLQNIILHEKYGKPYLENYSKDDGIISKQIEQLKDIYEGHVLGKKYSSSNKEAESDPKWFRTRKNAINPQNEEVSIARERIIAKKGVVADFKSELTRTLSIIATEKSKGNGARGVSPVLNRSLSGPAAFRSNVFPCNGALIGSNKATRTGVTTEVLIETII